MGSGRPTQDPAGPAVDSAKAPGREAHPLASLGRGSVILLVGNLSAFGLVFFVKVLLVNVLSTPEFGVLTLAVTLFTLFNTLVGLGLAQGVPRQLAHTHSSEERRRIAVVSLLLVGIAVLAMVVLCFVIAGPVASLTKTPLLAPALQLLALDNAMGLAAGVIAAQFQGVENMMPTAIFNQMISPGANLLLLYILTEVYGLAFLGALWAYVAAGLIPLVPLALYFLAKRRQVWADAPAEPLRRSVAVTAVPLLAFTLPLAVVGFASTIPGTADVLIMGLYQTTSLVASYSASLVLGKLTLLGITVVSTILVPVASRLHRDGEMGELRRSYASITKWGMTLALPLTLLFCLFPVPSLELVYHGKVLTPPYAEAPLVLQIVALGGFLSALVGPVTALMIGVGRLRVLLAAIGSSAAVDVALSFILVPLWGPLGGASAVFAATLCLPIIVVVAVGIRGPLHPWAGHVLKPTLAAGIPVVLLAIVVEKGLGWSPSPLWLPVLFVLLAFLYIAAVLLTRSIVPEDGHLLQVGERMIGVRLTTLRRLAGRFLPKSPR